MKSIFILYLPGHAGNFLTRLFSLSPETLPQVPIDVLKKTVIETGQVPEITNRAEYYSFNHIKQFNSWQEFHRAWPDFYQHELFQYFNQLYPELYSHVVYAIHPHEFKLLEDSIVRQDADYYYVDLADQYFPWVLMQRARLNFQYRPTYQGELDLFNKIKTQYNMVPIDLTRMLDSTVEFVGEYQKISKIMNLTTDMVAAQTLYHDWYQVRGPK